MNKMKKHNLERILIIPDQHFPFNDKKYWKLLMQVGKTFKPHNIIILGDFIDNYSVSSHDKDPRRKTCLDDEIESAINGLKDVKKLKAKNNVFISGNHEYRLERMLMKESPETFKLLSNKGGDPTKKILTLDELGFKYVPYRQHYKLGKAFFTHDVGEAGRFAHVKAGDTYHKNIIIGHTHTIGYAVQGDAYGDKYVNAMFGWGGDNSSIDYMHKAKIVKNWALGFGVGYLDKATGFIYLYPVPVVKYSCVVEGKFYKI